MDVVNSWPPESCLSMSSSTVANNHFANDTKFSSQILSVSQMNLIARDILHCRHRCQETIPGQGQGHTLHMFSVPGF